MRKLFLCMSVAALTASATAQCFDPVYGTSLGFGGDVVYPIQPIGFAFPFCGATYTDIHVCDKGYVYLSNAGVPAPGFADFTVTAAELASGPPRICALWADIQCLSTNNGECFLKSTPTMCTITWKNARCYAASSGIFDIQMKLSSSGTIEFVYGPGTTNNSAVGQPTWQVGLTGVSPGMGVVLPSAVDLSLGGANTDNTLHEVFPTAGTFDMPNTGLLLLPTNPGWAYVLLPPVNCASASNYGLGCINAYDSVYEYMTSSAFDLSGATLTYLRQPSGYLLLNSIPGTFVTPSGSATIVANLDDTEQTVALSGAMPVANGTTSSLTICSNGRIALSGLTNGIGWTPDITTFLGFLETTIAADWHDYNPTIVGSGSILFEQVGGIAYVTWNGVYSFGTTVPNTFQYQFNVATGDCTIVYGAYNLMGNDHLVGYSVGGPSLSSIAVDMSAFAIPISLADVGVTPLAMTNVGVPSLGNPAFTLTASNVPPVLPLAFMFFGDTVFNPGIDLSVIGMAGCSAYTNANLVSVSFPVVSGSGSVTFGIPNNPTLVGITLSAQSLAFSTATALGLVASNGTQINIGF